MILSTPASVPPGLGASRSGSSGPPPSAAGSSGRPASAARAPLVLLFPAAVVAGAGLGLAALAGIAPPAAPVLLPPPAAPSPAPVSGPATEAEPSRWAPLFGTAPAAVERPAPIEEPAAPEQVSDRADDGGLVLRGLALADDPAEAFAIVEGDDGLHVVRPGSLIAERFEVQAITAEGMAVRDLDSDALFEVLFPDDGADPAAASAGDDAGFDDAEPEGSGLDGMGFDDEGLDTMAGDDDAALADEDPALRADRSATERAAGRATGRGTIDLDLYRREAESRSEFIPGNTGIPSFGISR